MTEHGSRRTDPYRWLQRLNDPRVRAFFKANNAHARAVLRQSGGLISTVLAELRALVPQEEGQAPWHSGPYWYRLYYPAGSNYPRFVRRRARSGAPEECLLDGDSLARGHACFFLEGIQVSPDHAFLLYAVDTTGDRRFRLAVKDLAANRLLPDRIENADSACAWMLDRRSFVYVRLDPVTLRPWQVRRHAIGTDPARDPILFEEPDPAFRCLVGATHSRRHVLITCFSDDREDVRCMDAAAPDRPPVLLLPRRAGLECEADHDGAGWIVRSNRTAPDFSVESLDAPGTRPDAWLRLVPGRPGVLIERALAFRDHLAMIVRDGGRQRLRILDRRTGALHEPALPDPDGHVWLDANTDPDAACVRFGYTSLISPPAYYDYDLRRHRLILRGRERIPGYDRRAYATRRVWVPASDGARMPVILAGRREVFRRGSAPLLLFAYGAYGTNIPLYFSQNRLPLLRRGFLYGMAHVRGGSELGRAWYAAGRLGNKPRSIADFIECAEFLTRSGIARRGRLFAETLSAGGLVIGSAVNRRPDLFRGVVAQCPFVDLLNSMADPALPYTCSEYREWGDPLRPDEWRCLRSYSPYDTIRRQAYPHMLITASLNDSQVPCWEPAKWAARLREANTADTQILLRVNLVSGHSGTSGRLRQLRDTAFTTAFLLNLV